MKKRSSKLRRALREAIFGFGEALREGIGVAEERISTAASAASTAASADCGGCGPRKRAAGR